MATDRGEIGLPAEVTEMPDGVVWLPTNSIGSSVRRVLGVTSGAVVTVRRGFAENGGRAVNDIFLAQDPTLADFGKDPWWLILIKVVVVFIFGMSMILLGVWFERRVVARMAVRPGLNQVGPFGLLQTLADGIKGMLKEDLLPRGRRQGGVLLRPDRLRGLRADRARRSSPSDRW